MEDTGMAGRMREQRSAERKGQRHRLSPWIRFIIGVVLILLVTGLLLLWVINTLDFIQKPWSTLLNNIFTNIYTFIVSVGVLIIGIINANSKEVFQKFFPNSANKEVTSESAKEVASFTTTSVTSIGSRPEDATQSQHNGETISDNSRTGGPQGTLQLEIVEPAPIVAMPTTSSSIFLFNEHLPDPSEFYGRKLECEALINRARKGASTSIVGQRRIGKTWLIEYLIQVAPTELVPNYRAD